MHGDKQWESLKREIPSHKEKTTLCPYKGTATETTKGVIKNRTRRTTSL